jgi:hypothetical protein
MLQTSLEHGNRNSNGVARSPGCEYVNYKISRSVRMVEVIVILPVFLLTGKNNLVSGALVVYLTHR